MSPEITTEQAFAGSQAQETPPAVTAPPSTDIRQFINEKGELIPGWAKALGAPEGFEKKFTSLGAAFGSHANLESMIGKNKVALPDKNSTDEEWSEFYAKIGRPETPEGYRFEKPSDEELKGLPWDDNMLQGFAKLAHEAGLTEAQFQKIVGWHTQESIAQIEKAQQNAKAVMQQASARLREEWGGAYDSNLATARNAARMVGGEELLNDPALANNPAFIKAMAKVGSIIGEGGNAAGLREAKASFGGNPREEINKIMSDKSDPYWNSQHPQNAARVAYVEELYARVYPDKG